MDDPAAGGAGGRGWISWRGFWAGGWPTHTRWWSSSPGQRLVMRTAQGPFPMQTTYTWQPEDAERTRMTLRNQGEPGGFAAVAGPVMAAAMPRANPLGAVASVVAR